MGYFLSFLFVFAMIGAVTLLEKRGVVSGEWSRKAIHIGVAHWWFIAMAYFKAPIEAAIVPAAFVGINYASYKKQLFKSMERGAGAKDLGTVYYAVSLFVLALWTFAIGRPEIGGVGILTMGYADGFAAVIGQRYGKRHYSILGQTKSIEGSLTAFGFAFLVVFSFSVAFDMGLTVMHSLVIAAVAMLLEAVTPLGFDNLSVPIGTSGLVYLFVAAGGLL